MSEFGVVTEAGTLRLERLLPGPIERVWEYLTDSKKRGRQGRVPVPSRRPLSREGNSGALQGEMPKRP